MGKELLQEKVSLERWQAAQRWEENHWLGAQKARSRFGKNVIWRVLSALGLVGKYRGEDWNSWWKARFNDYGFLPSQVDNALEVGCGPYTNMAHIQQRCRPLHLVLSDPLIRTYVKFKLTFVAEMYQQARCVLDDHPLEELPFRDAYFDLVVMINVLDHVRDARLCMRNVIRVTRPGGILIIGQDLTNEADTRSLEGAPGEIGHPIRMEGSWFEPYLKAGFEPVIYKVLSREEGRGPEHHCGTLLFAGRKTG